MMHLGDDFSQRSDGKDVFNTTWSPAAAPRETPVDSLGSGSDSCCEPARHALGDLGNLCDKAWEDSTNQELLERGIIQPEDL